MKQSSTRNSESAPINLVDHHEDPLSQSSSHSPPREEFVDEEQGLRTGHTKDLELEQGKVVASEEQVQAMIQNVSQMAKNEKPDPIIRPDGRRRSSSDRRSESRRSSSRPKDPNLPRSSSPRRSASGRPSASRSRSRRESSAKRESSSGRTSSERRSSSERRHSSHRKRSSSRKGGDRDRGSRSRSRHGQHHRHRSSRHKKEEGNKIVDEVPKIPEKQPPRKKNYGMFVFLMMLLIIPAMIFVYFFLFAPNDDSKEPVKLLITNSPTLAPTIETARPTQAPTEPGATPIPSLSPSMVPTPSPSDNMEGPISEFFTANNVDYNNTAVKKAVDWLIDEAYFANSLAFPLDEKYLQRFGILALYFSIFQDPTQATLAPAQPDLDTDPDVPDLVADIQQFGEITLPNWGMRTQDHCFWRGMVCNEDGMIIEIRLSNRQLTGTLPKELGLFPSLRYIDFSNNQLQGSIPEELYDNMELEHMYLYKNSLSGTISSKIGNLWNLTHVHLSHNQISGPIPNRMASRAKIRQIRYFNVHRNQMTGTIPANMRLRQMFYMDLGANQFSGPLPPELGSEYVRLRHLFLDHNQFTGTMPQSYIVAGNGRIRTLEVNDNQLRGAFPGNHQSYTELMQLTLHNNNFDSMDKDTCKLEVFVGGELVEFKSQCSICRCGGDSLMCRFCV
ncbi:unnamed protein product [Cylindrotheca closterium]|uniref:Leucine-rich repeat-containing N-terminal plant-type domain-containing protein n=1 Tax=Cylindrotheca closterium TaxID=2856 RepID=A0AAD2GD48_9STRA|nr:unnamed protein product [Cylindrotheca closterium]